MAQTWNDKIVEDANERRSKEPERYPRVLGQDVFTDDKRLN